MRKMLPGIGDGIASAPAGVDATGAAGAGAAYCWAAGAELQLVLQEPLEQLLQISSISTWYS